MSDYDAILTVPEAAALLKVCPKTVYTWAHRADFPCLRLGNTVRIHKGQLIDWVKTQAQKKGV